MPLACLAEVRDPCLMDEVLYLHVTYGQSCPDVARNYVSRLLNPKKKNALAGSDRESMRKVLSCGLTAHEVVLSRCSRDRWTAYPEICEGLTELDKKRIQWVLHKLVSQKSLERRGLSRHYSYRLK